MDVMITHIAVWLVVVLAVAGLLIYVHRRVKRILEKSVAGGRFTKWRTGPESTPTRLGAQSLNMVLKRYADQGAAEHENTCPENAGTQDAAVFFIPRADGVAPIQSPRDVAREHQLRKSETNKPAAYEYNSRHPHGYLPSPFGVT